MYSTSITICQIFQKTTLRYCWCTISSIQCTFQVFHLQKVRCKKHSAKTGTFNIFTISTETLLLHFHQYRSRFWSNYSSLKTERRQTNKRLTTRAAYLESCPDFNTDAFLKAFARFSARRSSPKTKYSDNEINFVGASNELKRWLKGLNNNKIKTKLAVKKLEWKLNYLYGPHFGGAWERLIQIATRII